MASCKELKEKVPTCFEINTVEIGNGIVLPNYAKAYTCLWELAMAFNIPLKDVWHDEALVEMVALCNKLSTTST
jgi:hypothetical protein